MATAEIMDYCDGVYVVDVDGVQISIDGGRVGRCLPELADDNGGIGSQSQISEAKGAVLACQREMTAEEDRQAARSR